MSDHSVAEHIAAEAELQQVIDTVYEALDDYVWNCDVEYFGDTTLRVRLPYGSFIISVERE